MDPIAHSLFGATLGQTRLKVLSPLATATLIIGANLPDIDVVVSFLGSDASLYFRRGHTHGIVAMVVLPILLALAMKGYDRFWRQRRHPELEEVPLKGVLLLSCIGVWSHPFLDWMNTYGVRLLMPFDGRWFYGDTLFIIDAWMWLLMGAAVVFAYSQSKISIGLWVILGAAMTAVVTLPSVVPPLAKVLWMVGVALIIWFRWRGIGPDKNQDIATVLLVSFFIYLGAMAGISQKALGDTEAQLPLQDARIVQMMTRPVPANPFVREVLVETTEHYYGFRVSFFEAGPAKVLFGPLTVQEPDEIVAVALQQHEVRGFVNWMRFPHYEVRDVEGGKEVILRDLRYVNADEEDSQGIGMARVFLDEETLRLESPEEVSNVR